jgi:transcriptional regulator with XRE-family HTH domain
MAGGSGFGTRAIALRLRLTFHSFPQPHHLFHSVTSEFVLAHILSTWNNTCMIIGDRLRALREEKKLSQGDIEKRTGLLRCYISRVENGHTVPAIETLEKMARALECPLYQLFYDGEEPPVLPNLPKRKSSDDIAWGTSGKEARFLNKLRRLLGKADEEDRKLILYMAQKMANR